MRRKVVGLLLGLVALALYWPASVSADDCDDLARAGGAANAAQAEQQLTAIVQSTSGYSDAQKRAAQSGLNALQTCLRNRAAPPPPPPTPPQPPPQPTVTNGVSPRLEPVAPVLQPAGEPARVAAPPAGAICSNPAVVAALAPAQQAYIARARAAQSALIEAARAAGTDRAALGRAEAAYAAALRGALGEAMQQARGAAQPRRGDAPSARSFDVPGTDVVTGLGRGQLEALGAQFARLCTASAPAAALPPPPAGEPSPPERAVALWFNARGESSIGQIRKAGSATYETTTGDDLSPGDTIRANSGQLRVDLGVATLDPSACGGNGSVSGCFRKVGTIYIDRGSEVTFEKLPSGDPVVVVREGSKVYVKDVAGCAPNCVITETKARWFLPKGTDYGTDVAKDGTVALTVLDGSVEVRDGQTGASALVQAQQRFAASDGLALDAAGLRARITPLAASSVERWWEAPPQAAGDGATNEVARSRTLLMAAAAGALVLGACAAGFVLLRRRSHP